MAKIIGHYGQYEVESFEVVEARMQVRIHYRMPGDAEHTYRQATLGEWNERYRPVKSGEPTRFNGLDGCRMLTDEDEYFQKVY